MSHGWRRIRFLSFGTLAYCTLGGLLAQAQDSTPPAGAKVPPGIAELALDITDTVLQHHVDPPSRQQMILDGLHGLYKTAGETAPPKLAQRVSALTTREQFRALIEEVWPRTLAESSPSDVIEETLVHGLLASVRGGGDRVSAKDQRVQEQMQGNRYVGIHIQLRYEESEHRAVIQGLIPGGPADRAGARTEDRIETIDGVETRDMALPAIVDRLRGESGSGLTIQVRQPRSSGLRTLQMVRGPLFVPTVSGLFERSSGGWEYRAGDAGAIAYLRIREISASTAHELRERTQELRSLGFRALVLDLRGAFGQTVHPAVLLADSLLDRGRIGLVQQADQLQEFKATPGSLIPEWPLAVLVDGETSGAAEWLAAALQDNHRAVLIGSATASGHPRRQPPLAGEESGTGVRTSVPIKAGNETDFVNLLTGRFERRTLAPRASEAGKSRPKPTRSAQGLTIEKPADQTVLPDVTVAVPRKRQAPDSGPRSAFGATAAPIDPWLDAPLREAVNRLSQERGPF